MTAIDIKEKSFKIFQRKQEWYLNNAWSSFCNAGQSLRKVKTSHDNRNPKTIGKVETDTINRERRKTMIAVQVKTYLTHINSQKTKPLLKVQKIMAHAN